MRDFLAATRDRVVVFDGGMGATLEQFDLSLEQRLQAARPLPRGAGAQPPGRHPGRARVDGRGRRGGRGDRHVPGLAAQARGVGPGGPHARDQPPRRRDRPQGGRRAPLRRRLDRPDRLPARVRGPVAGPDPLPRARRGLPRAVPGPARGRRRPPDRRDRAGHPRGQGRDLRHARGLQARRPQRADPGLRLAAAQRRQDAARHRHQRRAGDAGGAEGRRHRPQLLDRPRGHARRDPLPRRVLAAARPLHPERRHPAPGPGRRDGLPRAARAAGRGAGRVRRALRRRHRRRLLRHHAGAHPRDQGALRRRTRSAPAPPRARRTSPR